MNEEFNFFEKYWIFSIAFLIICINIGCRISDSVSSREYEMTEGTVIHARTEKTTFYGGRLNQTFDIYSTYVTIEFKPAGRYYAEHFPLSTGNMLFGKGDHLPVMYKMEKTNIIVYPAKRDWITGAWLDARKDYNTPLLIAAMTIIAGIRYLYLIKVLKPRFKNSWIVTSIAGMLSGVILTVIHLKIFIDNSEMTYEPYIGSLIGVFLIYFSFTYMIKMHKKSRLLRL